MKVLAAVKSVLVCALVLTASAALGVITNPTPQRSYVSLKGDDAANCGAATPCRTWQAALAQTQPGGEILTLDSGGFGLLNITQSVTLVVPPGVYGGMSPPSGSVGVTINAPGATVILKGLTIKGQSTSGTTGILVQSAGSVVVDNATLTGLTVGITATYAGELTLSNTLIRDGVLGIDMAPPSGGYLTGLITGVTVSNNGGAGLFAADNVQASVDRSLFAENGTYGIELLAATAPATTGATVIGFNITNSRILANAGGAILVADNASGVNASTAGVGALLKNNEIAGGPVCVHATGGGYVVMTGNAVLQCTTGVSTDAVSAAVTAGSASNLILGLSFDTNLNGATNAALPSRGLY